MKFFQAIIIGLSVITPLLSHNAGAGLAESSVNKRTGSVDTAIMGTPWEGEQGFQESVQAIMNQEMAEKTFRSSAPEFQRIHPFRIDPKRKDNPQNPDSPDLIRPFQQSGVQPSISDQPLIPQTVGINFTGATLADTNAFPPDSMGAVGPTQFIVAVNGRIRSFNKTTGLADGVLNVSTDVFFASVMTPPLNTNFSSDPRIRYDRLSGRWFITMIDVPGLSGTLPNRVMIAVSSGGTITSNSNFTFFQFQHDQVSPAGNTGMFADYPSLGIDANALYIGVNVFTSAGSFNGTTGFVVRKSSILGPGPIMVTAFRNLTGGPAGTGPSSPQGVDNLDPAATEGYFIGNDNASFGTLILRRVSNPGGTPSISPNITITVNSTSLPITVPHLGNTGGSNGFLDALDDRLFAAHIRNGRLWTAHNIAVNSSGVAATTGANRRDAVRWYELQGISNPGTPSVVQSGTVFDSSLTNPRFYWVPSVMVSGQGHVAMGFSTAGAINHADAATIGRLTNDPSGTMSGSPVLFTSSTTAYNPPGDPGGIFGRRWGDYSYTSLDPNDDMTMWTIQEFCDATNSYGVRVAKLLAPPPAIPTSASPATIGTGHPSVNVVITGTSISGSGFFDPGSGFANRISVSAGDLTVNSVTYTDPTHITLNLSTLGATAGQKTVTVTNPDGQPVSSSGPLLTVNTSLSLPPISSADFDGDGKTDVAVWRPADGNWWIINSQTGTVTGRQWGAPTDIPVPGDYDGDGKTDIAIWRPGDGNWWIINSQTGTVTGRQWGAPTDIPVPGDYDGDGKTDIAIWRPSDGNWWILNSQTGTVTGRQWGAPTDKPVPGDYDGDGKTDIAIWRPSDGNWWILNSQTGTVTVRQWGAPTDIPIPGDYDGDGKTDIAIWRPGDGNWWIINSQSGTVTVRQWGAPTDIPVLGDYDGDGKTDIAVWRPADGNWYIVNSSTGIVRVTQWGANGDIPINQK